MKQPFRITIEHYDMKVSIEKDHSDIDAEELADMLYNVSLAAGWLPEILDEIFIK